MGSDVARRALVPYTLGLVFSLYTRGIWTELFQQVTRRQKTSVVSKQRHAVKRKTIKKTEIGSREGSADLHGCLSTIHKT